MPHRWGLNIEEGKQLHFVIIEGQRVLPEFVSFPFIKKKKIPEILPSRGTSFNIFLYVFPEIICNGYLACVCMDALQFT